MKEQLGMSAKVDGVAGALEGLAESHRRLQISSQNRSAELRRIIVKALEGIRRKQENIPRAVEVQSYPSRFPPNLLADLRCLASESASLQKQISIIESLQFLGMAERESNIKSAHPMTFEWLFNEDNDANDGGKQSNILEWLRRGRSTFWISGKAGSGKSTLMKFFHNHKKTHSALRSWAGDRRLLVASFFFWNAGTLMQKSQLGLLQTLLYHIFRQAPDLIEIACPTRWQQRLHPNDPWNYKEIEQAFMNLGKCQMDSICFCFFVDGLDEYDGDHADIISILRTFNSSDAIKICFASRPWNVFESAYGENEGFKIRLQDLTHGDITRYAEEKLVEGSRSSTLRMHNEAYQILVDDIVIRSDGVFLWVYLVIRSLCRGMTNLDTPLELQERLRELPTELEAFFQHIFEATEKVYQQQAARIYRICLAARCQISALDLAWFAEPDADFGLNYDMLSTSPSQLPTLSESTVIRVQARCQDLLEFAGANLQFLHRSVKDFLETREMSLTLEARAGKEYNPHNYLCNSMLLQMRLHSRLLKPTLIHCHSVDRILIAFCQHARHLDDRNELDSRLLAQVDRSVEEFLSTNTGYWKGCRTSTGNRDYLRPYTRREGLIVQRDPLAPITTLGIILHRKGLQNRLEEVNRLLDEGADPNEENQEGISEWQRYLIEVATWGLTAIPDVEAQIIRSLLLHGAYPTVGGYSHHFGRVLRKLREEDAVALEKVLQSLPLRKVEQSQTINDQLATLPKRKRDLREEQDLQPGQIDCAIRKRR